MNFTAYIERDPESGMYIALVPALPGAHTQAESLDDLQKNLQDVVNLCLTEMDKDDKRLIPEFIGTMEVRLD